MSDPFRTPPGTNPPRYVRERSDSSWIGVAIAVAVVVGLGFWALSHRTATTTTANPPAVTAAPAPAAGVPAPRPEETTGQAAPLDRGKINVEPQAPR
jgi:hypothetical protein